MDAAEMIQLITAAKSSMSRLTLLHVEVKRPGEAVFIGATWPGHKLTAVNVTHPVVIDWQTLAQSAITFTQDTMPGSPCNWVTVQATREPMLAKVVYADGHEAHWLVLPLPKSKTELPFRSSQAIGVHLNNARLGTSGSLQT